MLHWRGNASVQQTYARSQVYAEVYLPLSEVHRSLPRGLLAASSAVSHGVIGIRLAAISEALQVEAPWRAGVSGGGSPWCFGYNTLTVAPKPIELCFGAELESCFTSVLPFPSKSGK